MTQQHHDPTARKLHGWEVRIQQGLDWGSTSTWITLSSALLTLPHVQIDPSFGTILPTLIIPPEYARILNADPRDPTWSMAAIGLGFYFFFSDFFFDVAFAGCLIYCRGRISNCCEVCSCACALGC